MDWFSKINMNSKAFARGGGDKNGVQQQFKSYLNNFLDQHKMRRLPLERFSGNRFNILFSSASNVFVSRPNESIS